MKEEREIERKIKSGEEVEITKAIEILSLLKENISLEEISNKTGISISKIEEIKSIFANWTAIQTLTQREKEVLKFIFERRKRKDIAQVLFVTESTVKKHTSNIYKKLEVANRTELFEKASAYIAA